MVETSDLMNIEMVNTICASQSSSASSNDSSAHNGFTNCQVILNFYYYYNTWIDCNAFCGK